MTFGCENFNNGRADSSGGTGDQNDLGLSEKG